jgi:hypothetical protein
MQKNRAFGSTAIEEDRRSNRQFRAQASLPIGTFLDKRTQETPRRLAGSAPSGGPRDVRALIPGPLTPRRQNTPRRHRLPTTATKPHVGTGRRSSRRRAALRRAPVHAARKCQDRKYRAYRFATCARTWIAPVDCVSFHKRHEGEAARRRYAHESSYITDCIVLLDANEWNAGDGP